MQLVPLEKRLIKVHRVNGQCLWMLWASYGPAAENMRVRVVQTRAFQESFSPSLSPNHRGNKPVSVALAPPGRKHHRVEALDHSEAAHRAREVAACDTWGHKQSLELLRALFRKSLMAVAQGLTSSRNLISTRKTVRRKLVSTSSTLVRILAKINTVTFVFRCLPCIIHTEYQLMKRITVKKIAKTSVLWKSRFSQFHVSRPTSSRCRWLQDWQLP